MFVKVYLIRGDFPSNVYCASFLDSGSSIICNATVGFEASCAYFSLFCQYYSILNGESKQKDATQSISC